MRNDLWRRFIDHLAEPAFAIAFGENSAIDVKFYFYPLIEKTCGWPTLYDLAFKNIQQYQHSNKQSLSHP